MTITRILHTYQWLVQGYSDVGYHIMLATLWRYHDSDVIYDAF